MLLKRWMFIVSLASAVSLPTEVFAATAAYWRHEEGSLGQLIPDGPDTVLDSSGNGHHMQTFSSASLPFTSATYSSIVSPLALRSGLPNALSLDFGPNPASGIEDGGGLNDDNFTQDKTIQTQLFTAMTFELAFKMNAIGGFQALFGKDGKPLGDEIGEPDSPVPPLKIMVRGDGFPDDVPNQLFVEWIDGDGDIHFLATRETVVANQWNHIAFTLSETDAELWVAGESGPYALKDSINGEDFAGIAGEVLIFDTTPFTVGRGMFNNGVTDWADAVIDEVRISDTALTSDAFLFEPAAGNPADRDGDTDVDGRDLLLIQREDPSLTLQWEQQFGSGVVSAAASGAVPEPSLAMLAAGALAACGFCRRR